MRLMAQEQCKSADALEGVQCLQAWLAGGAHAFASCILRYVLLWACEPDLCLPSAIAIVASPIHNLPACEQTCP